MSGSAEPLRLDFYRFPAIDSMPDIPRAPYPDYRELSEEFDRALEDPSNQIHEIDPQGRHVFHAYLESDSNEMVTWGILTIGAYLSRKGFEHLLPTLNGFYDEKAGLYLNAAGQRRVEYWYLFYANLLAGIIAVRLCPQGSQAKSRMERSSESMLSLAKKLRYDFNGQGYDFAREERFTEKDVFRQPDSIAGFAYQMLFAASFTGKRELYMEESVRAIRLYLSHERNPWYEIPNCSSGLFTAAWLNSHGRRCDVRKAASWLFDPAEGPLQVGCFGKEAVDGLMMGWRGESREAAESSAYSMETLMPLPFVLPSVRFCPQLALSVAKYVLHALTNFRLFYASGLDTIYETRPDLDHAVPYEKLEKERDGRSPAACGDFFGHRSVYGAGYVSWIPALVRDTNHPSIHALDLSLTDWISSRTYPVFLLHNPTGSPQEVRFTPAEIWREKQPGLYENGRLSADCLDLLSGGRRAVYKDVRIALLPGEVKLAALLEHGVESGRENGFLCANGAELLAVPSAGG